MQPLQFLLSICLPMLLCCDIGGAVAKLSALRLLRDLPEWPAPRIKCMCFATPAIGNAALADLVKNAGWGSHFKTYFLPGAMIRVGRARAPHSAALQVR